MPELPEVETIRLGLLPRLQNKTLASIVIHETRLRRPLPEKALKQLLGCRLMDIQRRGKYLLFLWDNQLVLLVHLGMSGRLGYYEQAKEREPHTHVIFGFQKSGQLHFRDPRRFGFIDLLPADETTNFPALRQLGVEPLSKDFRTTYLKLQLAKSKRPIKQVLMDNRVMVGVGNIYAAEALFHAGIHPQRPACSLREDEIRALRQAVVSVLRRALHKGGTTLNDFRNAEGEPGYFQNQLSVYGRGGEPCRRCGAPIVRFVLNGRSCFACTRCQK